MKEQEERSVLYIVYAFMGRRKVEFGYNKNNFY